MERKLVRQGRNALTVTLPAAWTQRKGLAAGDTITISEDGTGLLVNAGAHAPKTEITVDIRDTAKTMAHHLVMGRYLEGYDIIRVLHNNTKLAEETGSRLLGMIVEEQTASRMVLRNVIAVPEENIDQIFRRCMHMLVQQAQLLESIPTKKGNYDDVKTQERLLDYHLRYCMRYLTKYSKGQQSYKFFLLCSTIEEAGDALSRIAKFIGNRKALARETRELIEQFSTLLFSKDVRKLYTVLLTFRDSLPRKNFVDGLVYGLVELLYNYLGYFVEDARG
ncbi:hypothetical protein J4464_02010 [Candidatus Woesearchaeota archaeon]|nr:hypothetical protein [Candidatus Woesearchaeota archaeon]